MPDPIILFSDLENVSVIWVKSRRRLNERDHRVIEPYRSALTGLREAASTLPDLLEEHDVGECVIVIILGVIMVGIAFINVHLGSIGLHSGRSLYWPSDHERHESYSKFNNSIIY